MPEFYAAPAKQGHVKSPVEFVATALKQLNMFDIDYTLIPRVLAFLGQELFNPPNVGGWPGGSAWINAATLLGRFNFASQLTGDVFSGLSVMEPFGFLQESRAKTWQHFIGYLAEILGITLTPATRSALLHYAGRVDLGGQSGEAKIRGLVHLALISPEFQAS